MTPAEFKINCNNLCPHCAAGEAVRQREDTNEYVHDFSFGEPDAKIGRRVGIGHGICRAHAFRLEWTGKLDG